MSETNVKENNAKVQPEIEETANGRGMITRTFTGYNATILTVKDDGTTENVTEYINTTVNGKDKALKKLNLKWAGKGIVTALEYVEETRGITVDDFYKMSIKVERPASQQAKVNPSADE